MIQEPSARLMPQSLEAEVAVLGGCIAWASELLDDCLHKLSQAHFYPKAHQIIFCALVEMKDSNAPVDAITVTMHLKSKGLLEDAGGDYYISKISGSFPPKSQVMFFVQELDQKLKLRKLLEISADINHNSYAPEDPDAYISKIEKNFYDLVEQRNNDNLLQSAYGQVSETLNRMEAGEGIGAIPTGIWAIDKAIMGIVPGMMDVYAAEAGCGKTSMIEMMAIKMLLQDEPILIFQRDMTPAGFYLRLACRCASVNISALRRNGHRLPSEVAKVKKWAETLSKTPLKLFSPDGCTGADVKAITRREASRSGIKLVVVDHMRTLRHTKKTSWDGLEENSGYIRQSTNDTGIPHIVLTHINREGAKSDRPTISDIKGGDQLKDDSDNCCVMWAPEGRPAAGSEQRLWKVNFAFDKTRWDWNSIETMNYNGPRMAFEKIEENK